MNLIYNLTSYLLLIYHQYMGFKPVKYFFSFLLIVVAFLLIRNNVFAVIDPVDPTGAGLAPRWSCLQAIRNPGHHATIQTIPNAAPEKKPLPNTKTYIVECLSNDGDQKCTTVNEDQCPGDGQTEGKQCTHSSELDKLLFKKDVYDELYQDQVIKFEVHGNSPVTTNGADTAITSDANGNIGKINWWDTSKSGRARKWLALNFYNPEIVPCGTKGGDQQCTFKFTDVIGSCAEISWDPEGRVFDSQSLEPLPGVQVSMWTKPGKTSDPSESKLSTAKDASDISSFNPNPRPVTDESGMFAFFAYPGFYELRIADAAHNYTTLTGSVDPSVKYSISLPSGVAQYQFKNDPSMDTTSATKAYNDDGKVIPLYAPFTSIKVPPIQHRDIPLVPMGKPYVAKKVTLMGEYFISADARYNYESGRVSHPFAKVCRSTTAYDTAYDAANGGAGKSDEGYTCPKADATGYFEYPTGSGVKYPLLGETDADQFGMFKLPIDLQLLTLNDSVGKIRAEKTPVSEWKTPKPQASMGFLMNILTKLKNIIIPEVSAAEYQQKVFQPILNYLDGYAMTSGGKTLPNATVGIYLSFSDRPYYQTKADSTGHFIISSENLPALPYKLVYTGTNGSVSSTTTNGFLAQNKDYMQKNKVNPYVYKTSGGVVPTLSVSPASLTGYPSAPSPSGVTHQVTGETSQSQTQSLMVMIVILVVLIAVVAAIIGYYLLKKKQNSQPMM